MMIEVLKSKLHCVEVTEANLKYMGSITIDEDLMDAAARKCEVGDTIIIISYATMDIEEARNYKPTIVFPKNNKVEK